MPPDLWHHYMIEFADPAAAEAVVARHLAPVLDRACIEGRLSTWWYLRKSPGWRLRYQAAKPDMALEDLLGKLTADGHLARWNRGIYEPETTAFGGPEGMEIAHTLFHHDSRHLLERAADPEPGVPGRREATVLLYNALLQGAGLDWFEVGDTWTKVQALRPASRAHPMTGERAEQLAHQLRALMSASLAGLPLAASWTGAFESAGRELAALARTGTLHRGLRPAGCAGPPFHLPCQPRGPWRSRPGQPGAARCGRSLRHTAAPGCPSPVRTHR
jgi:protein-L-isoaspartate(D-aspartate) O-methyltransferase